MSEGPDQPAPEPAPADDVSADQLVADGRYAEAASRARAEGDSGRAAQLYEQIWDFASAAACAREAGDLGRALRNAIDAHNDPLVEDLVEQLRREDKLVLAVDVLAHRRRFSQAGVLAEETGDFDRAIELYRSGHRDLDTARLLERVGRDREAGRMLERMVAHSAGDPMMAPAHLQLGMLLARRMKHDDAVRHLQEAMRYEATRTEARHALLIELVALGLRDAARNILVEARAEDPSLPAELDEFVRANRGGLLPASTRDSGRDDGDPGNNAGRDDAEEQKMLAGRYRVERPLGSGGAGRVFAARDEVTGRHVAVKVFNTVHARGREAYERFVREAKVASSLRHPNLVEVFDFSADRGFLVMEYMTGGSLAGRLAQRAQAAANANDEASADKPAALEQSAARRMVLDVIDGLELAHRRGIVHRDVKPPNIFFDGRGTAKLGDFGIAHLLDLGQTQTGGLIGTLAYMSPEQITGAPLSVAADLYALGVTLFQALTGRLPFLGPDFVAQHLGEQPPAVTDIDPTLAPAWNDILARLLAKSPTDRFDSIDELRRAVRDIDLGVAGAPRPLVLPRASARAEEAVGEEPTTDAASPDGDGERPRYEFETSLGRTPWSRVSRAVDTSLDRSVILERFNEAPLDEEAERRLYAFARGGGPYLQRILGYDRDAGQAVYEAPSGAPIREALHESDLNGRGSARLLKRLARALAPLHEAGLAHGAIDDEHVVVDSHGYPTVLVSGLGHAGDAAAPAQDVAAIVALASGLSGVEPATCEGLINRFAAHLSAQEQTALSLAASPRSAEELYRFADALEIAVLRGELQMARTTG